MDAYYLAGIGPSGQTPPTAYESAARAREAVLAALDDLIVKHPDDRGVIRKVRAEFERDPEAANYLDYFQVGGREHALFFGPM